ncbi:MAG: hypothetical protein C5S52_03095 [ANME-2 cluster archaeon]|nr:hypothetical protein [ANME-2 cluster archaeon]
MFAAFWIDSVVFMTGTSFSRIRSRSNLKDTSSNAPAPRSRTMTASTSPIVEQSNVYDAISLNLNMTGSAPLFHTDLTRARAVQSSGSVIAMPMFIATAAGSVLLPCR